MTTKNITPAEMSKCLGISLSTLCNWKNDEKLLNIEREQVHALQANKTKRLCQLENPLLGSSTKFEASNGWLDKWKKRHHIRNITLCGEKKSADYDAATEYRDKFHQIIQDQGLTADQVFNADETSVNYRQMPRRSLAAKEEVGTSGFKIQKERITAMACSNASGTIKLPLVVIGKYAKPRAIKDHLNNLPVSYKSQKSAWMTTDIFSSWFYDEFVPFLWPDIQTYITES
ncbi:tigger transposable element-derived protein 1-like [Aphidius gifuensis]|uniref:tigger transposable element-derived protein 1-like n=1 Tax=Aphidius gifuensis TaxID=684658 RepID=UPI001CDD69A5|nr:tigger transposable element-derived protein 1-like [Aphidius gifuensis]